MVNCKHSTCDTPFCPSCGEPVCVGHSLVTLLRHIRTQVQQQKVALTKAGTLEKDWYREKKVRQVKRNYEKWSTWENQLAELMQGGNHEVVVENTSAGNGLTQ